MAMHLSFSDSTTEKKKESAAIVCVCVWSDSLIKFDFQQLFSGAAKAPACQLLTSCQEDHFGHFQVPSWYHVSFTLTQDSPMIVTVTQFFEK